MIKSISKIEEYNQKTLQDHKADYEHLAERLTKKGYDVKKIVDQIRDFKIAIPSWALGTGGTRFGRFPMKGEPSTLEEKIEDVALLNTITGSCNSISLHIPWDIPKDIPAVKSLLQEHNLIIDSVNSNTFQDQNDAVHSYKFGSLSHTGAAVRKQAIDHNLEVISIGEKLGSKTLTVWLADGSNFPGQQHLRNAYQRTSDSINEIYKGMYKDWTMLVEYKPFEPNFYSMVIPDWGTAYLLSKNAGDRCKVLVDLGHHLPNTNIEQIVARLMHLKSLGGFHFNGSLYADDDLTTGATKPYQLFLIFHELVQGMKELNIGPDKIAWMIDASHNTKDPLEDLIQSMDAILIAYAQALLVHHKSLTSAQEENDPALAQELIQDAFRTDVRPLLAEARKLNGAALSPTNYYRTAEIRKQLISKR
jgi:L-rhamnose isomerase/sugar isomerase